MATPSQQPHLLDPGHGLIETIAELADGRRIRAVIAGEGDGPLIVFESGMGAAASEWTHIQRQLSNTHRTLSYDRANIGGSDEDRSPRSLTRIVDDLTEVIDTIGSASRLVLVGHSWGGPIIRLFANRHPRRVTGLVLVDATPSAILSPTIERAKWWAVRIGSVMLRNGPGSWATRLLLPFGASAQIDNTDVDLFWRDVLTQGAITQTLREGRQIAASIDLMRTLEEHAEPQVPTIVLQGGRQRGLVERRMRQRQNAAAATIVASMQQGRLVVLEDSGHLITHERPDAVVDAVHEVMDG